MIRLVLYLALASVICKLVFGRWPWDWLSASSPRGQALANARRLLGTSEGAGREEILDAHKRLIAIVHPDRGGTAAQVHEANAARDLLLDDLPRRMS